MECEMFVIGPYGDERVQQYDWLVFLYPGYCIWKRDYSESWWVEYCDSCFKDLCLWKSQGLLENGCTSNSTVYG